MFKRTIFIIFTVLLFRSGYAQVNIIPQPVEVKMPAVAGNFLIDQQTTLVAKEPSSQNAANFFNDYLKQFYGFTLKTGATGTANSIVLSINVEGNKKAGAYSLEVGSKGIISKGNNAEGVFYSVQSLIQLLPVPDSATLAGNYTPQSSKHVLPVPFVTINDYPRFAYRGMHLDVARHFFPVLFVKKYIDYLALHKMNYFHWHLTDDQGWRIEIKKYPLLTEVGGFRNGTIVGHFPGKSNDNKPYGGFYTQEQVKDVVAYAAKRYITVIPEIELPGHSSAAIAAYPKLSCFPDSATKSPSMQSTAGNQRQLKRVQETWGVFEDVYCPTEYTFSFLEDVLNEVIVLFPSKYIHIGGDECPKDAWKKSAFCQQLIKEKGLKDEHGLQSYFIQRIEKYLNGKGRNIIGWDEILEGGLAPNATVMSWRGEAGGIAAARNKHNVIMTPSSHVYLDHSQTRNDDSLTIGGYTTLQKVYSYEPVPKELSGDTVKYVLGAQANLWSEYLEYSSKVEYQVFPRMSALSEVLWSDKSLRNWEAFTPRLQTQFLRYRLWGVSYSRAFFDPASTAPLPPAKKN